jgi:hypothetical protein
MLYFIIGVGVGILFSFICLFFYIFYQNVMTLKETYKDGWDNPF